MKEAKSEYSPPSLRERVDAVAGTFRQNNRVQLTSTLLGAESAITAAVVASDLMSNSQTPEDLASNTVKVGLGIATFLMTLVASSLIENLRNRIAKSNAQRRGEKVFQARDERTAFDYITQAWQEGMPQNFTITREPVPAKPLTQEQLENQKRWDEALRPRTPEEVLAAKVREANEAEARFTAWQNGSQSQSHNPFIVKGTINLPRKDL